MTIQEIKELIQVFHESGVAEMEVQRGENRLRLARGAVRQEILLPSGEIPASLPVAPPISTSTGSGAAAAPARAVEPNGDHIVVKSPIVGTYYDQPSPGSPPFVRVGDPVEAGQVLCIIESMKLMNEIEAETSGIVAAKMVENGRPVEYGEPLFSIKPR
jgi:acetyl-CoA carboxylase biotin carboxyl carrier protein